MSARVQLGPTLSLPADVLTSTVGILGIRGSGKTNTAGVIVEEATRIGIPSAVADPTGAWWGIKSSSDGKSAGLPFYVFGGEHADVPLEPEAGEIMGRFAVERRVPIVLDLSLMTKGRQLHFMAAYAATMYHANREAFLQVIDETARFCPQTIRGADVDASKCLGAVEDMGALGRVRGLGLVIIGQRAAKINKDVLTQCHTLIVHQTNSPQDKKAVDDWIGEQYGAGPERDRFLKELPMLKRGEAFVWSPTFGIFERAQIRPRSTFDSSKTPEIGKRLLKPTVFASVDLEALSAELSAAKTRAVENDPAQLKARIRQLEAEPRNAEPIIKERIVEKRVVPRAVVIGLRSRAKDLLEAADRLTSFADELEKIVLDGGIIEQQKPRESVEKLTESRQIYAKVDKVTSSLNDSDAALPKAERTLLTVIAQFESVDKSQLSVISGYSMTSSSFSNAVSRLRSLGYVTTGWPARVTPEGRDAIGTVPPLPTGAELRNYWIGRLPKAEGEILRVLITAYPVSLEKREISERSGYSLTSSSFSNALSKLRSLKLAEGYGSAKASATLF